MRSACKGCEVWENRGAPYGPAMCEFKPHIRNASCPCLLCLVKMMYCDGCDEYNEYINLMEQGF